mmetsp:Transcript_20841/g.46270  ORF Transcript_20841/g.46270 Transcript_20841/m.46270 type:complete len:315 (-) Transcript_20841:971-1915(-)
MKMKPRRRPERRSKLALSIAACAFLFLSFRHAVSRNWKDTSKDTGSDSGYEVQQVTNNVEQAGSHEEIPIYTWPAAISEEPDHLDFIDFDTLIPTGFHSIDLAHREGLLHTGHVLYVMDSAGMLLLLKRSNEVVTCPGTWSLLGEHAERGEDAIESAIRGLREELGLSAVSFVKGEFENTWSAEFEPNGTKRRRTTNSPRANISLATKLPLYYIRFYGPRSDDRIDRQLTYLWIVQFSEPQRKLDFKFDHEVKDHKWLSVEDLAGWLSEDARKSKEFTKYWKAKDGVRDSGPSRGDFCHGTIVSLYLKGLEQLL